MLSAVIPSDKNVTVRSEIITMTWVTVQTPSAESNCRKSEHGATATPLHLCMCAHTRMDTHTHSLSLMHTSIHIPTIAGAKFGHNPGTLPWLVRSWGKDRSNEWKAAGTARCISLLFQQWCGEGKTHTGAAASLAQKWTVNKKVKEAF